jgi:hypothetical protein
MDKVEAMAIAQFGKSSYEDTDDDGRAAMKYDARHYISSLNELGFDVVPTSDNPDGEA